MGISSQFCKKIKSPYPEPALGEGEQGPRPGPRACGGPAGHQRGAPHRTMQRPRGAPGPQRGEPRTAAFLACDSHILGPPQSLLQLLLTELAEHGFNTSDIRGQGYDNGANMKGHKSGVQARLLELNPRAFFTPCVCYNYNLLLGDIASSCSDAVSFFGILQRIYVFFSASTQRWTILQQHVKSLSVKPLSDTWWECRIESVKAVRYQTTEIRDALIEAAAAAKEPLSRSEAESLCKELESFRFIMAMVFWHDILFRVNYVSKQLQSSSSDMSLAIENLQRLSEWMSQYRQTGFIAALTSAWEIADELEIDPTFPEKRVRSKKEGVI